VLSVDHPRHVALRIRKSRVILLIQIFVFMTCYRVKFTFIFTFDYDYHYHTFVSARDDIHVIRNTVQYRLNDTERQKKKISGCQPEELLDILLQTETRVSTVQET